MLWWSYVVIWPFNLLNLQLKEDFVQLLKDTPDIHRNSNWEDAKHKLDSDPRYVAVNSSPKREEWFKEYIKGLVSAIYYLTFSLLTVEMNALSIAFQNFIPIILKTLFLPASL